MLLAVKDFTSRVRGQHDNESWMEIESQIVSGLEAEDSQHLINLTERLDNAIKPFGEAFVKLSSRRCVFRCFTWEAWVEHSGIVLTTCCSPKDACFYGGEIKELIKADIEKSTITPGWYFHTTSAIA